MAKTRSMVHLKANCIPKARELLPFVYEPWRIALKQSLYVDFRQLEVLLLRIGITHVEDAFGDLLTGGRFATPFCTFNKNSPSTFQSVCKDLICNSFFIVFCHLPSIIAYNRL